MVSFHDFERDRLATLKLAYGAVPEWWSAMRPHRYREWLAAVDADRAAASYAFAASVSPADLIKGVGGAPYDPYFFLAAPQATGCVCVSSCCCEDVSLPGAVTATFEADTGSGWVAAGSVVLVFDTTPSMK